ncbi:MAG: hypothetical protein L6V95_06265 [Candidatus Melainabacteria bacterium]|nr:MAG: hypothetical protein L6V95_06265 [Candidatus Melainabacteria bacterium]
MTQKFVEFVRKYNQTKFVLKADGFVQRQRCFLFVKMLKLQKINLKSFLAGEFQEASKKVLVEKYQEGKEISLICLFDGKSLFAVYQLTRL